VRASTRRRLFAIATADPVTKPFGTRDDILTSLGTS
jgi:hypothetical protein